MLMDAGLDTGDVVLAERTAIAPDETYGELHDRLARLGAELLGRAIDLAAQGPLTARPQTRRTDTNAADFDKRISRSTGAGRRRSIVDHVRAYSPQPAARADIDGETVKVLRAHVAPDGTAGDRRAGRAQSRQDERRAVPSQRSALPMNARDLALHVVRDVFPCAGSPAVERGAQAAFDYRARRSRLQRRDRAFAAELAYGAHQDAARARLVSWSRSSREATELPPVIREILRLAVYELVYTRADEHATVFEFVNLAKRYGHRGLANLVNAVLRSLLRAQPSAPVRELFDDDDEYLGTRYSLPTWIVRQWRSAFGDAARGDLRGGQRAGAERHRR